MSTTHSKDGHFPDFSENQPQAFETGFRRKERSSDQKEIVQTVEEFKRLTTGLFVCLFEKLDELNEHHAFKNGHWCSVLVL